MGLFFLEAIGGGFGHPVWLHPWLYCQSATAMDTAPEQDIKLTLPEIHGNHSIGDDSAIIHQYSVTIIIITRRVRPPNGGRGRNEANSW